MTLRSTTHLVLPHASRYGADVGTRTTVRFFASPHGEASGVGWEVM